MTLRLPTPMRAATRLAVALLAIGGLLAGLVGAAAPAAARAADVPSTRDYDVEVLCEPSGGDRQQCSPRFSITVETQGILRARFVASPVACSAFQVSFFHERVGGLPGAAIPTSGGDFLAPGASSREVEFRSDGPPGPYRVWVWAQGRPGGCNGGSLTSWGGTLSVTTSGQPNPAPPREGPPIRIPPTVRLGASGKNATTIQYLLSVNRDIEVDGDFGPQTEGAVRDFQRAMGLKTADGVVGPETWAALFMTVRQGDQGVAVRAVQSQLASQGVDIAVDAYFGPQTEAAVRAFQQANGLTANGTVGPHTWAALVATN